jgi:hypothetical protein
MSSSSLGASRVGTVMSHLAAAGFRCGRMSASGQHKGARRDECGLAGDVVAIATDLALPHLLVEVGGSGKRLGTAFTELRDSLAPGFGALVVRFVDRRSWWYVTEDDRFANVDDALDALRTA